MSFFPDSSRVFLVVGNNLEIIDTTSFAIVDTVAIPASGSVVFTSDGSHAYAPLPSQNQVAVLTLCTPPVITDLLAAPNVLWPPNHKMIPVNVSSATTGGCGAVSCKIISVSSNEPVDADGDWVITGNLTLDLRAERLGTGTGRTYTITVQCTDGSGNNSTKTVAVTVPHDQGKR